jgi:PAS domain S-box-containing protein
MKEIDHRTDSIIKAITEIGSGNFSVRLDVPVVKDGIDRVSNGINRLAGQIRGQIEHLKKENEKLTSTVTQLKELKLTLPKSEELFWRVFQTSPDGISISRLSDGIFIEVNAGFEKLSGYQRKELIGHSVFDVEMWTDPEVRDKMSAQLKEKGYCSNLESDFRVKGGKIRIGLLSSSLMNIKGEPHMITVSRDITEIRKAERELLVSQKKYQELVKLSPDGIILMDLSGNIEMANAAFLRIAGTKAGNVYGMAVGDILKFNLQDKVEYNRAIRKILKSGRARSLEMRFTSISGDIRTIEILTKPLKHEGRITGIQAVIRDITERIRAMEFIKTSEIQYRTSMDALHSYIYLLDSDLKIILANKSLKKSLKNLGLPTDVVGKHYLDALPFLENFTKEGYLRMFKQGKPIHREYHYAIGENKFVVDTRIVPIIENKKITRILTIVQDITKRKKAEYVQQILYNISNAVNLSSNLHDLFLTIQNELGKIFDTRNFFIALYNKKEDTLTLPFFIDEKDSFDSFPARPTLTGYMIRNDRPLLMKDADIRKLVSSGEIEDVGTPSKIWLGVPLKLKDDIIGALVVQNYEDENAYSEKDLEILQFVSTQISLSVQTKRAYDEVQLEKAYFEQLFESSPESIVVTDNDGRLLRVNNEFEKLFGYSREECLGKFIDELIVPVKLHAEARNISEKVARGEKIRTESVRKHKNGKHIHVSVLGTPIETAGGQVAVYGIYRDITEKKNAEIALKESEEKLRNILYSSPDAISVSDLRGNITECNQAALDIFECESDDQLIGKNANDFVIPEQKTKGVGVLKKILRRGFVKNVEFEVLTCKGHRIDVDLSASLIKDTNDHPLGIATITQDITERKVYEKALKTAKEKAEESDRLKSAFLANMSHEIRTPMNAILGFSELLRMEDIPRETRDEYIKIISSKGKELMLIINDIIDISKIEAGDIKISHSDVAVHGFLEDLFREFNEERQLLRKNEIRFRLNISQNTNPIIHTDPSRLKQILYNLVSNAFKFTQKGFIELGCYQEKGKVIFYVKDTGIGIEKDKTSIIFDRFRQVDESINSEFGGTGLGLAISRHLCHLLGGEIWLDSIPGKGSTFYFYLPMQDLAKPGNRQKGTEIRMDIDQVDLSGKKILVAEDDPANFKFIESYLKNTRSTILWAKDGEKLLEIFQSEPEVDLILMDLRMPGMNGMDATRIIRKTNPDIPVIAISAYAFADDREKSMQAGCNDFLAKPIRLEELSAKLTRFLSTDIPPKKS